MEVAATWQNRRIYWRLLAIVALQVATSLLQAMCLLVASPVVAFRYVAGWNPGEAWRAARTARSARTVQRSISAVTARSTSIVRPTRPFVAPPVAGALTIDAVPPEVLLRILSYLDQSSLARASRVQRRWAELARHGGLWRRVHGNPNRGLELARFLAAGYRGITTMQLRPMGRASVAALQLFVATVRCRRSGS